MHSKDTLEQVLNLCEKHMTDRYPDKAVDKICENMLPLINFASPVEMDKSVAQLFDYLQKVRTTKSIAKDWLIKNAWQLVSNNKYYQWYLYEEW